MNAIVKQETGAVSQLTQRASFDLSPRNFDEALRFWGVVWACCVLGGLAWGALIAMLKGMM